MLYVCTPTRMPATKITRMMKVWNHFLSRIWYLKNLEMSECSLLFANPMFIVRCRAGEHLGAQCRSRGVRAGGAIVRLDSYTRHHDTTQGIPACVHAQPSLPCALLWKSGAASSSCSTQWPRRA